MAPRAKKEDGIEAEKPKKKKEGVAENPMAKDDGRWLTPERYRRIGKYMKPWGKPPTGVTFWVQLLTTVAVIVISIFKGVDSSVELVISYGVPEYQQRQAPENLAFGIVFILTCSVVLVGYLYLRFAEWRMTKQLAAEAAAEEAEKAERLAAKQAKAAAAGSSAEAPKAKPAVAESAPAAKPAEPAAESPSSPQKGAVDKVRLEGNLEKLAREGNAQLHAALQQVVEEGNASGASQEELQARVMAVRQSHAQHMQSQVQMVREMEAVRSKALAEGATDDEANRKAAHCAQWHQHKMQMQQQQHKALRMLVQEALEKDKCPQAEVQRRVDAMQVINQHEVRARQEHMLACTTAEAEAIKEGLAEEEVLAKVKEVAAVFDAKWVEKRAEMMKQEEERRKEVAEMLRQRDDDSLPAEIREMLMARVRINGLAAKPELNGRIGLAKCYVPDKERFAVAVEVEKGEKPIEILLKPANLSIVTKVDAEGREVDDDAAPPPLE